jgi:NADH:ubiquinone oxidoreductase subunit 3 (subunit A)
MTVNHVEVMKVYSFESSFHEEFLEPNNFIVEYFGITMTFTLTTVDVKIIYLFQPKIQCHQLVF